MKRRDFLKGLGATGMGAAGLVAALPLKGPETRRHSEGVLELLIDGQPYVVPVRRIDRLSSKIPVLLISTDDTEQPWIEGGR